LVGIDGFLFVLTRFTFLKSGDILLYYATI
jgi:hypothetical protein